MAAGRGTPEARRRRDANRRMRRIMAKRDEILVRLRQGEAPTDWALNPAGGSHQKRRTVTLPITLAGQARALELGHDMEDPEPELSDDGWRGCTIAMCRKCGGYAVADRDEGELPYGLAVRVECPGRYMHGPARRRSLMELEAAITSASNEPPDGEELGLQANPRRREIKRRQYAERKAAAQGVS